MGDSPAMREQLIELIDGIIGNAAKNIAKPGKRVNLHQFARSNKAAQHRRRLATLVTAEKRPVAASNRKAAQRPFCIVVVDRHPRHRSIALMLSSSSTRRQSPDPLHSWATPAHESAASIYESEPARAALPVPAVDATLRPAPVCGGPVSPRRRGHLFFHAPNLTV